jgi:hypothetical protein
MTWEKWKEVGAAAMVGRRHAMALAKTSKPAGKRYNEAFGFWVKTRGFDEIDPADLTKLLSLMGNLEQIEKWLAGKTDAQRASWNHPSTIWRVSRCKDRGIEADNQKRETPTPNPKDLPPPAEEFSEENETLAWQRGLEYRARKAIHEADLGGLWIRPEPPDAGLVTVVRLAAKAWDEAATYLESIVNATPEESAEARTSHAGRNQRLAERKKPRSRQDAEPALEDAD